MDLPEVVIAVRSYNRAQLFAERTYKMLTIQTGIDLSKQLYVFVADEDEKKLYEDALGTSARAAIVVGKKGGKEAIDAITNYFPEGQMILFLDDDFAFFYEWTGTPHKHTFMKNSTNLKMYIDDAMQTMAQEKVHAATFSFMLNDFYIKDKPFKEIRTAHLVGGAFMMRNDRETIQTRYSQCDDLERTCKFFDKYGPVLIYNWTGFDSQYGVTPGGMQSSGDRGTAETKTQITKDFCEKLWAESNIVRMYANEPKLDERVGLYIIKIKTSAQLRKLIDYNKVIWPNYFDTLRIQERQKATLW